MTGILIGHKIRGIPANYPRLKSITIIAGAGIAEKYGRGFQIFGLETALVDGETAAFRGDL